MCYLALPCVTMDIDTLPQIIGANFRQIRVENGVTQAEAASHAKRFGLKWDAARVGDFERGRFRSPFGDVLAASAALDNAIGARGTGPLTTWHVGGVTRRNRPRVKLADLVRCDGFVALNDGFTPTGEALARVCDGKHWELWSADTAETADFEELQAPAGGIAGEKYGMTVGQLRDVRWRSDVTETRVARKLGIDRDHLLALCWSLWSGRTFSEERDVRSASNPARRAQVSRELRETLEQELTRGND